MNQSPENTPVMPAPPGQVTNFSAPENKANQLLICAVICPVLSAIFVAARIYTQARISRAVGLDDCAYSIICFRVATYTDNLVIGFAVLALVCACCRYLALPC